jgi:very-short-patch-repair endonuclease
MARPPRGAWQTCCGRRMHRADDFGHGGRMAARADQQDRALGLMTRADAFDMGLTGDALAHRVRTGRLLRPQRGVYLDPHVSYTPVVRARAALLAAEPGAVVSGLTAARVWGWFPVFDGPEELTIGRDDGHRVSRRTLRWIRRDLSPEMLTRELGFPVTVPLWTLVDVLSRSREADAIWVADQALRVDPALASALLPCLEGRYAARALRRLGAAEPRSESPLETLARLLLRRHGFAVVVQHPVSNESGQVVARADLALPSLKIAIETDGRDVHGTPDAIFRDRRRQNMLVALGWIVLRFTWRDVTADEGRVLNEVRSAVDRAEGSSFVSRKVDR